MNIGWYATSLAIHLLAATLWIGGMLFLVFVLVPELRKLGDPRLRIQLIRATGIRFRLLGWICLGTLLVTGFTNLLGRGFSPDSLMDSAFWQSGYGRMLAGKLALFALILAMSGLHDWIVGPRASAAQQIDPGSPRARRLRAMATWFGRFNLLISLVVLIMGILLSRGIVW